MRSALRLIFSHKARAERERERALQRARRDVLVSYWNHEITPQECNALLKRLDPPSA